MAAVGPLTTDLFLPNAKRQQLSESAISQPNGRVQGA